jgi:hypothetical protein
MQVPYLKKNAKPGLWKETGGYARCDLIVYRILFFKFSYLCVVSSAPRLTFFMLP